MPVVGFEKWLQTERGKRALNAKDMTDQTFLKNRLWWAYHAGNTADQVWMTTEVQPILEILSARKLPRYLKQRIEYVLNNKADYSIQKL